MFSLESTSCIHETGNDSALDRRSYEGLGLVSIAEGEARTKTHNCQQEYSHVLSPHDRSPFATRQSRSSEHCVIARSISLWDLPPAANPHSSKQSARSG